MDTPIYDFLKKYADSDISRLHMPGHKGSGFLGVEKYDITEIKGADSLYEADGIIRRSEKNASEIFGSGDTFYSAEGSSLCIRAMLYAAYVASGKKGVIAAVRNVHKSFVFACATLGIDVEWVYPGNRDSLCGGCVTAEEAEKVISEKKPFALYITSPNYLGEMTDIKSVSDICRKYGIPLLVDNAHGAYFKFTGGHPINSGAAMCCDSAHKTLPVITGGAYLHVSQEYKQIFSGMIKDAMSVFGSTSPSYLILSSLDLCNKYMTEGYAEKLSETVRKVNELKKYLKNRNFELIGSEPLKLTVKTDGEYAAEILRRHGAECEYADKSCVVMMFTPGNSSGDFEKVRKAFSELSPEFKKPPVITDGIKVMSIRDAVMSRSEKVNVTNAVGRVCASPSVSCPPAVPVVVSGELITEESIDVLMYYGITDINCI